MKQNPFIVAGRIPEQYFCDRTAETKQLIKSISNQENVVLISPRRMGKSELINHCFDFKSVSDNYFTLFIDILHTTSLRELTLELGTAVYRTVAKRNQRMLKAFLSTIRSLSGCFGYDPLTNMPTFNVRLGDIASPEYTLDEIFNYLENADKRCIVAIDEFQQIANYPEKNVEAVLRSRIQRMSNANFIYSGSERHILDEMFLSANRPFYQSATIITLSPIELPVYRKFATTLFASAGKRISDGCFDIVYEAMQGITLYLQRIFHDAYVEDTDGTENDAAIVRRLMDNYVEENGPRFTQLLSMLAESQKETLYAILSEGEARQVTSADFVRRHRLKSASSVQASIKRLMDFDVITRTDGGYKLSDPLFRLWLLKRMSGQDYSD